MSPESSPPVRFHATVLVDSRPKGLALVSELALDRLPDAKGMIQVLITAEEARRLLDRGVQLQLHSALPVRPLDKRFIFTDEQAKQALEKGLKGMARQGGA
jgi:hypothetical protein